MRTILGPGVVVVDDQRGTCPSANAFDRGTEAELVTAAAGRRAVWALYILFVGPGIGFWADGDAALALLWFPSVLGSPVPCCGWAPLHAVKRNE